MINKIKNYLSSTNRRKILNKLQDEYSSYYRGIVLDIGGRDRGVFKKPKDKVQKWIFADIVPDHNPDIILDVMNMSQMLSNSIDVVNAIELFEHVREPEKGIAECYRVLRPGGTALISSPLIFPIHADPYDFQRWTDKKWKFELEKVGFKLEIIEKVGGYFAVAQDMYKSFVRSMPKVLQIIFYIFYPFFDFLRIFDKRILNSKSNRLRGYTTGYFIIAKK